MANHVLLNNVQHKDLRIITDRAAKYGDNIMCVDTFPFEFRNLQAHYPIFFRKDKNTDQFQPVAVFGFEQQENLFLNENGWDADYVPLMIERQPFLIGFQNIQEDGVSTQNTVIHIDMDNTRISQTEGETVFLPHGGNSEYIEHINSVLQAIHDGQKANQSFVEMLVEFDLLESFVLDVELNNSSSNRLLGFYTINEEKLDQLSGDALAILNSKGYLQPIYMAVASLSNIRLLIERKNKCL